MRDRALTVLLNILHLLPRRRKRQLLFLLAGCVAVALVEMASVGSLALMAAMISNPSSIHAGRLASLGYVQKILAGLDYRTLVLLVSAVTLILLALKNALGAVIVYANATVAALIDAYFGEMILQNILTRPHVWLLGQNTADLFTLASWRRHVGGGILFMTLQLLSNVMIIGILLIGLLIASPLVSAMILAGAGLAGAAVFRLFQASSTRVGLRLKQLEALANRSLTMTLRGAKDVKIFGLEAVFRERFAIESCRYAWCEGKYRLFSRLPSMFFEVLGFAILFAAIAVFLFLRRDASAASILSFLTLLTVAAWRILNAINQVLSSLSAIRLDIPPAQQILHLLDQKLSPITGPPPPIHLTQEIRLDRVVFTYPGAEKPALKEISLTIPKGLCLGLVGQSGSGKSTLVDLLIGLLSPGAGTMTVDGQVVDQTTATAWMHRIGYVGQAPYLLDASLKENIAFGVPPQDIDLDRVRECCRLAHVDEFLPELSRGLDTSLGEAGGNLSGGQRQRVAIARALYRRPEVLILDEATSALDIQSENALRRTIQELSGHYTLIIIAHRLSAVEPCHALLWLDEGAILAFGPTDEVLSRYRNFMDVSPDRAPLRRRNS